MAMIACPACRRSVSEAAAACPGCGHPLRREEPVRSEPRAGRAAPDPRRDRTTKSVLGCLLAIGCLFVCLAGGAVVVAAVTKPSEAEMRRVVVGDRPEAVLVAGAAEAVGLVTVSYSDYLVYRTMQVKVAGAPPRTVAVGFLGRVERVGDVQPVGPPPVGAGARPHPGDPAARPLPGALTKVPPTTANDPRPWVTGRLTPAARGAGFDVVLENTSTAALEDVTIEYRAVDGHTRVQAVGGVRPGERKQIDPSPWRVEPGESFTVRARGREAVRFAVNPLPK